MGRILVPGKDFQRQQWTKLMAVAGKRADQRRTGVLDSLGWSTENWLADQAVDNGDPGVTHVV